MAEKGDRSYVIAWKYYLVDFWWFDHRFALYHRRHRALRNDLATLFSQKTMSNLRNV
jgi:hypothetical protein